MDPSPSLEYVTLVRKLSTKFNSWLERACKVYDELLRSEAIVDNVLFRDKVKELTGEEKTEFVELLMAHDKVEKDLEKFVTSKDLGDFRGYTDEDLIKWVDEAKISVGYCGFRERSAQHWLWDIEPRNRPYNVPLRRILEFYRVPSFLPIPSREKAEADLIDFVANVKDWARRDVEWVIKNFYPLEDGFWTSALKAVGVATLKDLWEEAFEGWKAEAETALQAMPEYADLGKAVADVPVYVKRDLIDVVATELLEKYGRTTESLDKAKADFVERCKQVLAERVPPESRIEEVYEQVKMLVPAEKVEKTRAGLMKAIRYVFAYPDVDLERLASWWVFPLDFTTEQAREIASKIMEKVVKIPPPPPVTPCDVCGNVELNWDRDWAVSDEEWQQVVPEKLRDSTLCPWCFVKFAAEHRKEYEITYHNDIAIGVKKVEKPIPVPSEVLESLRADLREKGTEYSSITDEYTNLEASFNWLEGRPNLKDAEDLQSKFLKFLPKLEPLKRNYEALRARASELYGKAVEIEPPEERLRILRELDNIMKAQIDVYVKNLDFYKVRVETYMLYRVNEMIKELRKPAAPKFGKGELVVWRGILYKVTRVSKEPPFKYDLLSPDRAHSAAYIPEGELELAPPPPEEKRLPVKVAVGKSKPGEYTLEWSLKEWKLEEVPERPLMFSLNLPMDEIEKIVAAHEEFYDATEIQRFAGEDWYEELPPEFKESATVFWTDEQVEWSEDALKDREIFHLEYKQEDLEVLKVEELREIAAIKNFPTVGKKEELIDRILGVEKPPVVAPPPPVFKYVKVRFKKDLPYGFRAADGKWIEGYKKGDIMELPEETAKDPLLKDYLEIVEVPPPKVVPPVKVPPVERGLQKADERRLLIRFESLLLERTISPAKWRPMFEDALFDWRRDYKDMPRDEAVSTAMKDVEDLVERVVGLVKPPVKPPIKVPVPEEVLPVVPPMVIAPVVAPPPGVLRKWGMPWGYFLCPACIGEGRETMILRSLYLERRLRDLGLPTSDPLFFQLCDDHRKKYGATFEYFPRDTIEFWVGETVEKAEVDIAYLVGMGISEDYVLYCVSFYRANKHLAVQ